MPFILLVKKVAGDAKAVAKAAWNKAPAKAIGNGIKSAGRAIASVSEF